VGRVWLDAIGVEVGKQEGLRVAGAAEGDAAACLTEE